MLILPAPIVRSAEGEETRRYMAYATDNKVWAWGGLCVCSVVCVLYASYMPCVLWCFVCPLISQTGWTPVVAT